MLKDLWVHNTYTYLNCSKCFVALYLLITNYDWNIKKYKMTCYQQVSPMGLILANKYARRIYLKLYYQRFSQGFAKSKSNSQLQQVFG